MQRDGYSIQPNLVTRGRGLTPGCWSQTFLQEPCAAVGGQIAVAAEAGMIAVGVRDYGKIDRFPRIDKKIAFRTVDSPAGGFQQRAHNLAASGRLIAVRNASQENRRQRQGRRRPAATGSAW